MVILLLVGGGMALPSMSSIISGNPVTAGIALILVSAFGAAALALLSLLGYLDPKPVSIIAGAFTLGALVATTFAQILSVPLPHMFAELSDSDALVTALAAATGEETYKALAVVVVLLVAPWWWNRLIDGMVIGAAVGLGFQLYEDVVYLVTCAGGATPDVPQMLTIFFDRAVLGGLASHLAYTAIFGTALAYAFTRRTSLIAKVGIVLAGYATAWSVHVLWDAPFLINLTTSQGGLILYSAIKSLPTILVLFVIGRLAYRELRVDFTQHAATPIDSGSLNEIDVETVSSFSGRRSDRASAKADGGRAAADQTVHDQRNEVDLVRLYMHNLADGDTVAAQTAYLPAKDPVN